MARTKRSRDARPDDPEADGLATATAAPAEPEGSTEEGSAGPADPDPESEGDREGEGPGAPSDEGGPEGVLPEPGEPDDSDEAGPSDESGETAAQGPPEEGTGSSKERRRRAPTFPPPPAERLEGAVEALLLAAGESLSDERIRDLLGLPSAVHVRDAVEAVRARWAQARLPVEIQDVAGGRRVVTRPEFAEYVGRLHRRATADRLSRTLLETLSIVAYRQPVARAEIERVRGVQSGDALRGLLDRRLVKVSGRSDQPGRPLLYATTTRFLEVFGLASLSDLPNAKDLVRL
jgi:segregation and condensation protein B